jgi:hypothetical protein
LNNVNKKNNSYSFLSDTEPTKEQLDDLMIDVMEDVKERAIKADAKYKALQATALQQAQEMWQKKLKKDELR